MYEIDQCDQENHEATPILHLSILLLVWVELADVEFVTKVTSDTCEKYLWSRVELSRINAKFYPFCEIYPIKARVFTKQLE